MAWLRRLWSRIRRWLGGRQLPASDADLYRVVLVDDEPDLVEPRRVYAVGENGHLWHATLLCPCGCGERISLNLLPDDSPCWVLLESLGVPTLRPSVSRNVGCRSHFFLRAGKIEWCAPSGEG